MSHAATRDPLARKRQANEFEVGQSPQVDQPGVGHFRLAEVEHLEVGQPFEVLQAGICDVVPLHP